MPDYAVREVNPLITGQHLHQVLLDGFRIIVLRQFQAPRDAVDMSIYHPPFGPAIPRTEHDIGGLARSSRDSEQLRHCLWYFAVELFRNLLRRPYNRFGFIAKKSRCSNVRLEFLWLERCKVLWCRIFLE